MSHPSRCGTDCDSTTNQHILKQCPILQGVGQTVTPLQTNTSCSNVPSFKVWDKLWLHYKPTHPVAMSHPSRRATDCDSTTNQHILKQCPILQGVGQTVTPLQTNTSWSNVPSFKVWDRLWLHYKPTHPEAMSHPSRCGTDCDSTTNQHILKQCPVLQGVRQTVTPLQTNTSWSNVPSFKVWDRLWLHYKPTHPEAMSHPSRCGRLWLHYKPTHPVAMSYPSRRGTDCDSTTNQHPVAMSHPSRCRTDCDSTTNQHILKQCPILQGVGDCDSTTNQHILKQCPILQGVGQTVTPLQTNTSCSNVLSFKAWDRLWLHYKPTHPEAMSHPSRRETDCDICCDSTTAQLHGSRREWEKVAHFILQMILLVQLSTKAPSISYSQRFLY